MAKQAANNGAARTEYVVLKAVEISAKEAEAVDALGLIADQVVWAPVMDEMTDRGPDQKPRVFVAASKTAAIRLHTGDGADVKEGTWKAVPVSSWRGGEVTKRVTAAEREAVLD